MDGADSLVLNQAYRHVIRMSDGSLLNRYWDDRDTPRDESWLEDVETAKHSGRPPNEVYRDLRAGAASGWDYSSRWLRDAGRLASIRTIFPRWKATKKRKRSFARKPVTVAMR